MFNKLRWNYSYSAAPLRLTSSFHWARTFQAPADVAVCFSKLSTVEMERRGCVAATPAEISALSKWLEVRQPSWVRVSLSLRCFQQPRCVLSRAQTRTNQLHASSRVDQTHLLLKTKQKREKELKANNCEWSWKALLWVQKFPTLCLLKVGHPGTPSATQIYLARCSHSHLVIFLTILNRGIYYTAAKENRILFHNLFCVLHLSCCSDFSQKRC